MIKLPLFANAWNTPNAVPNSSVPSIRMGRAAKYGSRFVTYAKDERMMGARALTCVRPMRTNTTM